MAYFDKYGVEFSDDHKTLLKCPQDFEGEYIIPDGVLYISGEAFIECCKLTSIIIPNSVTWIGPSAFENCKNLTTVAIPKSVKTICTYAFGGCSSLTIHIHAGIEYRIDYYYVEDGAFAYVANIIYNENISQKEERGFGVFTRAVNGYQEGDLVFSDVTKKDLCACLSKSKGEIFIPEGVRKIKPFAFVDCNSITKIHLPSTLQEGFIEDELANCTNLEEIVVPVGQEERFCKMGGLEKWAEKIRSTSINRRREEEEQRRIQEQQMQEMLQDSILFFDTETTGKPFNYKAPVTDLYNWTRLVQLAWIMADKDGNVLKKKSVIIKPDGFSIPAESVAVHGITTERAQREGLPLNDVLEEFATDLSLAEHIVGHNIDFDQHIVGAELCRLGMDFNVLMDKPCTCTMKTTTKFCAIPNPNTYFGGYKWPSLQELYQKLFGHSFDDAHDALADITATKECYFELKRRGII